LEEGQGQLKAFQKESVRSMGQGTGYGLELGDCDKHIQPTPGTSSEKHTHQLFLDESTARVPLADPGILLEGVLYDRSLERKFNLIYREITVYFTSVEESAGESADLYKTIRLLHNY
jgi:hypothetical protein